MCYNLLVSTVQCLSFTVLNGIYTVFETIKVLSNSLPKVYIFSVVVQNLSLRGGPTSMICDITNTLEANHGPIFSIHNLETYIRSSKVKYEAVKLNMKYLHISRFWNFNDRVGIEAI